MKTYNIDRAIAAQERYQAKSQSPKFAPENGVCYSCKLNIYSKVEHESFGGSYDTGFDVGRAGSELVTGCPHCNKSFCD